MTDEKPQQPTLAQSFLIADSCSTSLAERLARYASALREADPKFMAAYDEVVRRTVSAGMAAPLVGEEMPEFVLPDQNGRLVTLRSLREHGPVVVSFNRGHWCSFCRLELRAISGAIAALSAKGAGVVSIQPETAAFTRMLADDNALPFSILSDIDLGYSLSLGLATWVGEPMRELFQADGIDLARFQGNDSWLLPIPATFVVGSDGIVRARSVDSDFRKRMEIDDILAALDS